MLGSRRSGQHKNSRPDDGADAEQDKVKTIQGAPEAVSAFGFLHELGSRFCPQ
jgi:hypothetical protein